MCAFRNPFSPSSCRRSKRRRSPPGNPGPHTRDDLQLHRQRNYPPASPASACKLRHFRAELFGPMPDLRSGTSTATLDKLPLAGGSGTGQLPPPVHLTPTSEEETPPRQENSDDEPRDASPRRPRHSRAPDLEDALTRLTQTVERMAAIQQPPAAVQGAEVPEDPDFNWFGLRSPLEATFPLPATGVVQRIAAGLFAKLQAELLTGRDQHEARFVLDMISDWEDMDVELRTRVFQRLNVYAIVATHGWPTAIAATAASTNTLQCFLPPGVQPVVQAPRQQQQQQRQPRAGRRGNANPPAQAPAPPPAQPGGPCSTWRKR